MLLRRKARCQGGKQEGNPQDVNHGVGADRGWKKKSKEKRKSKQAARLLKSGGKKYG